MTPAVQERPNLSLFGIETQLLELLAFREDVVANDPDATPQEISESLAACDKQIEEYVRREVQKADNIAAFLRECEARTAALKAEAGRIMLRAKAWEQRGDQLKAVVSGVMKAIGKTKIEGAQNTLAVRKNPPSADIAQPSLIPPAYKHIDVTMRPSLFDSLCNFLVRYEQGAALLAELMQCKRGEEEVSRSKVLAELKSGGDVPGARLVTDKTHLEVK
jgi:hypothetical protein